MDKRKTNILIVGGGENSIDLIGMLSGEETVNIVGVVDPRPDCPGINLARKLNIPTMDDWRRFLRKKSLNQVIELTGKADVYSALIKEKPSKAGIMDEASVRAMWRFVERKEKLTAELRKIVSRVFEHSPNIAIITNPQGVIEYVNSNFVKLSGYSAEEAIGKNIKKLYKQSKAQEAQMWATIKSGEVWQGEFQGIKKDQRSYWEFASITSLRDQHDRISHLLKVAVDITARKQAEEALRRDFRTTRRIIENAPFGIYVVTENGNVDYVNPAMLKISGETYKKFLHFNVFDLPSFKKIGLADKIRSGLKGEYFKIDAVDFTSDCSKKTNTLNFIGIPLIEDGSHKVLVIVEDITEQKKAEQELKNANEELKALDRMKSDFISTVSHEFRTPLASIREAVAQVSEGLFGQVNKEQKEFLDIAMEDIDQLWKIVSNLLDISKIEAGRIELKKALVDISEVAKSVCYGFQGLLQRKKLELNYILPEESVDVFIDTEKIREVLANLISNACKFTAPNGKITICIKDLAREIEVAVKDSGIGIAKEHLPRLFDKFAQFGRPPRGGERGTGLGLSICKSLIDLHGGRIWVESRPGAGSTFKFRIPKVNSQLIFKEYIDQGVRQAAEKESVLSLIVLKIENFAKLIMMLGQEKAKTILDELERNVKQVVRKDMDVFLRSAGECIILLYGIDRKKSVDIKNRILTTVRSYLDRVQKEQKAKLNVIAGISVYPEEAKTSEELLLKADVKLKDLFLGRERRKHARKTYKIDVQLMRKTGRALDSQSIDISEGGICISSKSYIKQGSENELFLQLPKKYGTLKVRVKVRWIKKMEETREYRVGLEFIGIRQKDKMILQKFLQGSFAK